MAAKRSKSLVLKIYIVLPDQKSVYFCKFLHCFSYIREIRREPTNENKHFKETKTFISNSNWIRQSFQG